MNIDKIYVYPKLSNIDLSVVRIGGPGLANCMFVAARAYIIAQTNHWQLVSPTWFKLSIGPYLRGEKDKRHYLGLFKKQGISGLKKCCLLIFGRKFHKQTNTVKKGVITVNGLGNYFEDLLPHYDLIFSYFIEITRKTILRKICNEDFSRIIGVHIRLGDYIPSLRVPIDWYKNLIDQINQTFPDRFNFFIFSDGTDQELIDLLKKENVSRAFLGNALADIWALSRCKLIIGSDSTFSGWGAFLGQVPIIYPNCHYGNVLINRENQLILKDDIIPDSFLKKIER